MKNLDRNVTLLCPLCGNDQFLSLDEEFEDLLHAGDDARVRCSDCGSEYTKRELLDSNAAIIDNAVDELAQDAVKELEKELKKAKEFLPGLYVPTYIPEGYEFEKLEIQKYYSGDFHGKYLYKSNNDTITILLYYSGDLEVSYQLPENVQLIELGDRKIIVFEDEVESRNWVSVYMEDCTVDITGKCSVEDLIMIGKKLNMSK